MSSPDDFLSDRGAEELLGAYALGACEPDEVAMVEAVLARCPDLAREAKRLTRVAAWLGADDAVEPPGRMRAGVVAAARASRRPDDAVVAAPALDVYLAFAHHLDQAIAELPRGAEEVVTPNGLSAHDLVVHMAAQESLFAQQLGCVTLTDLTEEDVDARTAALLPRFADRDVAAARAMWREAVDANCAWVLGHPEPAPPATGAPLGRDDTLLVRAFEAWIHADDLRAAAGQEPIRPDLRHVSRLSDLAGRVLPRALAVAGREHAGHTARLVLTGTGGGEWLVPMGVADGVDAGDDRVDVTVTADVLDWCLRVGDRLAPDALRCSIDGDDALGRDLVAAASALATL